LMFPAYAPSEPELTRSLAWFLTSGNEHGLGIFPGKSFFNAFRKACGREIKEIDPIRTEALAEHSVRKNFEGM